ncbi:hypothetical protein L0F63_002901, partial [Massospora cicadina]
EGSVVHVIRSATNTSLPNESEDPTASEGSTTSSLGFTSQNSESHLLRTLSNNPAM